jgi:ubiquinone biosynthesis protein Coq4
VTTAAEALAAHYAANGIKADPTRAAKWVCRLGPVSIEFPNWRWRQDAIVRHDLHHVLTGYPCTMTGEMQMAAWEFAAGRYRHWAATMFCLPLALMGAIVAPVRTAAAFRAGLRSTSLYGAELDLDKPLTALRAEIATLKCPSSASMQS